MRQDLHGCADRAPLIKIDRIFVEHADATAGSILADAARLQRTVEAIAGIDAIAKQVHCARAKRVLRRAAVDEFRQFGVALPHLRRRRPPRPERFAVDRGAAIPFEALAPDADAIADGRFVLHDQVEKMVPGIDDHGADRLAAEILDDLALPFPVDLGEIRASIGHAIVDSRAGKIGRRCGKGRLLDRAGAEQRQTTKHNIPAGTLHRQYPRKAKQRGAVKQIFHLSQRKIVRYRFFQ